MQWNVPKNMQCSMASGKADIIWRGALWKMLRYIGVDPLITSLIEAMYDSVECTIAINGQLTGWFRVEIGVRQGCLLSPILFQHTNLSFDIRYAMTQQLCPPCLRSYNPQIKNYKLPIFRFMGSITQSTEREGGVIERERERERKRERERGGGR